MNYPTTDLNPRIFCADGISLSVQANEYAYCTPRESGASEYSRKEVGFIQDAERDPFPSPDEWLSYADDREAGVLSDVFGYVPVGLIEAFIVDHGGRQGEKTMSNIDDGRVTVLIPHDDNDERVCEAPVTLVYTGEEKMELLWASQILTAKFSEESRTSMILSLFESYNKEIVLLKARTLVAMYPLE